MSAAVMTRFSYPKMPGDQPWSVVDIQGPASYVQVGAGGTGGQQITAVDCGLESIDWAAATAAVGNPAQLGWSVNIIPIGFSQGNPVTSMTLQWVSLSLAEAAPGLNLSGSTVRLLAIGH